jgi:hypothetical protein
MKMKLYNIFFVDFVVYIIDGEHIVGCSDSGEKSLTE